MRLEVVYGDLLEQDVDVIVNAWNRNVIPWWLLLAQGVSGAIKKRAGYAPFRELGRMGPIPFGHARLTTAGKLPHKAIIHVAGINLCWISTERGVRDSVQNAMALAVEHRFESIAFPLVGAGTGGGKAARVESWMTAQLQEIEFDGEVRIVIFAPGRG